MLRVAPPIHILTLCLALSLHFLDDLLNHFCLLFRLDLLVESLYLFLRLEPAIEP